jgi:hypothetical protein
MDDAASAQSYFRRVAEEVNVACDTARIPCSGASASMTPPLSTDQILAVPGHAIPALRLLLGLGDGASGSPPSEGSEAAQRVFSDMAGPVTPTGPAEAGIVIAGWLAAPDCLPVPRIVDDSGKLPPTEAQLSPGPDVEANLRARGQVMNAQRFELQSPCISETCRIVFEGCGNDSAGAPVASLKEGLHPKIERSVVYFDRVGRSTGAAVAGPGIAGDVVAFTGKVFGTILPLAFVVSLALYAFALYRWRRIDAGLAVVAGAALLALASRSTIIAVIDVSSWNAINLQYMMPAGPFALLFVA